MTELPEDDLSIIVENSSQDLRSLDGANIVVTGGTGFIGSWIVESILQARRDLGVEIRLTVPSRSPDAYVAQRPHLRHITNLSFVRTDIRTPFDHLEPADAIIHAATEASAALNDSNPAEMLDVIVAGMSNVLAYASRCGSIPFLFTSSGAVYGEQPLDMSHVPESFTGAPDALDHSSAYHEGKRVAELLGAIASHQSDIRFVSARLFAFLGPLLPLDTHFAAGNFLADALAGRTITVNGDGTPLRSYMHPIDMCTWLFALLARGQDRRAYNVGSEESVSIRLLAEMIDAAGASAGVDIGKPAIEGVAPKRYVPSTERARAELDLRQHIGLSDAIERTMRWHEARVIRPERTPLRPTSPLR